MKIRIKSKIPTVPSPVIGQVYEVVEVRNRRREFGGGHVYMIDIDGCLVGILERELEIVN